MLRCSERNWQRNIGYFKELRPAGATIVSKIRRLKVNVGSSNWKSFNGIIVSGFMNIASWFIID
jgi:hypothetical protein